MTREEANKQLTEINDLIMQLRRKAINLCDEHLLTWENPLAGYGAEEQAYVKDPKDWRYSNYGTSREGWYSSNHC